jgi:hypothetical protein
MYATFRRIFPLTETRLIIHIADCSELVPKIASVCQKLDGQRVAKHLFRIHLLQVGDDRTAVGPLHAFADQIDEVDRGRVSNPFLCD